MIKIDEALTSKVADLARLALTKEELTLFTGQIERTLGYVASLTTVPTEGIEPQYHPFTIETPLREDVVVPAVKSVGGKPKILEHAPETLYDGFKVPPIL